MTLSLENLLDQWDVTRITDPDCTPLIGRAMTTFEAGYYERRGNDSESVSLVYKHKREGHGTDYQIEVRRIRSGVKSLFVPTLCDCLSSSTDTGPEEWQIGGWSYRVCKHGCAVCCLLNDTQDWRDAQKALIAAFERERVRCLLPDVRKMPSKLKKAERQAWVQAEAESRYDAVGIE